MAILSRPALVGSLMLAAASSVRAQSDDSSCSSNTLTVPYPEPVAADGWEYRLVAQNLTRPRGILFDSEGALLVVDRGAGILRFEIEDNGGTCVSVGEPTVLTDDENLNHGIAISADGETLYASTENDVYSWPYDSSGLDADARRTLVTNMSNTDHTTRTLLAPRLQPGILIVSRGSDENIDADAEELESGHSQLRSFNVTALGEDDDAYDFLDGDVLGWGLRNSVGVAEEPNHGGIWSVENSVDEMRRNGEDIHHDNPGEELNFHGFANGSTAGLLDEDGAKNNYGYPLCYAIWGTEDFPELGDLETGDQFPGAETSSLTDESCNDDYVAPRLTFQAHTAPLDLLFTEDGSQAFISFHGSWNREDPTGYKVSSIAFGEDGMPSASSDSRDAAHDVLTTPDLSNCPDDCFRPVGLARDSEGRLWVSSDTTGELFVIRKVPRGGSGDGGSDSEEEGGEEGGDDAEGEDDGSAASSSVVISRFAAAVAVFAGVMLV